MDLFVEFLDFLVASVAVLFDFGALGWNVHGCDFEKAQERGPERRGLREFGSLRELDERCR